MAGVIQPNGDSCFVLIPLTQGQVAKVSLHRYAELSRFKWYARWAPHTQTYYAGTQVRRPDGSQRVLQMHRLILGLDFGDRRMGEHRNCDTLDNTDDNLRVAGHVENGGNRRKNRNNKSGYKGVSWSGVMRKWRAAIYKKQEGCRVVYDLGYFNDASEAHEAYRKAAVQLYGEFARFE